MTDHQEHQAPQGGNMTQRWILQHDNQGNCHYDTTLRKGFTFLAYGECNGTPAQPQFNLTQWNHRMATIIGQGVARAANA